MNKKKPIRKKTTPKQQRVKKKKIEQVPDSSPGIVSPPESSVGHGFLRPSEQLSELSQVSPVAAAAIAAQFQDLSPSDAISRSYELIHEALLAHPWFARKESFESAIGMYKGVSSHRKRRAELNANRPEMLPRKMKDGKSMALGFEDVLQNLMPRDKKAIRQERFTQWLAASQRIIRISTKGQFGGDDFDARKLVKTFVGKGVPYEIYNIAALQLQKWWEREKSMIRSTAGKKGGRGKGKQGRVIKKDDNRQGARPPGLEKLKKIVEST